MAHWWHHDRTGDKQQVMTKGVPEPPKQQTGLPSAADLDAVAEEQKAAEDTSTHAEG